MSETKIEDFITFSKVICAASKIAFKFSITKVVSDSIFISSAAVFGFIAICPEYKEYPQKYSLVVWTNWGHSQLYNFFHSNMFYSVLSRCRCLSYFISLRIPERIPIRNSMSRLLKESTKSSYANFPNLFQNAIVYT